ncbi:Helix-turn-helix type 3 domain protein [Candidatus Thiomargarita nelsonii]|uniref:Helix-turn-helix type 3 domain protein n=1 Tax=Candidatus Thiomargarita nelsonii TaxID=1003181 RepID=A0A0A6NYT6_9GAMM|nr:Helix-turn-helix type 3 domain protein [Candidatus Thiomargarita nelsonii]
MIFTFTNKINKLNMTGAELKRWREDFGLTQKRLSHLRDIDKSTISAWETGKRRIPPRSERSLKYFIEHVEQTKAIQELILDWDNRIRATRLA